MNAANLIVVPLREAIRGVGRSISRRSIRFVGGAMIFAVICLTVFTTRLIDRSLNYVPVDAMTRSVTHECEASRRVKLDTRHWHQEYISGNKSCEELRALAQTDDYRGYRIKDTTVVSLVYRSPVDRALHVGRLTLESYGNPVEVASEAYLKILASKKQPELIAACCDTRVDWFDRFADL